MASDTSNRPPESAGPSPDAGGEAPKSRIQFPPWAKVAIAALLVGMASIGYLRTSFWQNSETSKTSSAGLDQAEVESRKPIADFDLIDADGKKTPFSEYRGKVVILSFWASWCTPCLVELPTFAEIGKRFHDKGLRVVPINVDEASVGPNFAREFWKKKEFEFPNFFDAAKELAGLFEVDMLPANFVIDRQGRIVFSGFGANDWNNDQTVEFIESLLEEQEANP